MRPLVSVVIPVLQDTDAVEQLMAGLVPGPDLELILVDGGRDARLEQLAHAREDTRFLRTAPGRGLQMNAGAAAAAGEWLLFLHADSRLSAGWLEAIGRIRKPIVGAWFRFALDDDAWQARAIERLVAWRVRWLRLPYGDQGFLVRRDAFAALGGFRDLPLMEDVDFARRLTRAGAVQEIALPLHTSSRRWRRDGWIRRSTRNLVLVTLYFAGVSPARLARWY